MIFFSVGLGAFAFSMLMDVLLGKYTLERKLARVQKNNEILRKLISDYETVLMQIKNDPNIYKRIAPAVLGTEPADPNTAYPKATAEQLAAVRKALTEDLDRGFTGPAVPRWLVRCNQPYRRIILLLAGAFLIIISFMCFSSAKQSARNDQ